MNFIADLEAEARLKGIDFAVANSDTPVIFDWLLTAFSFQGVSDQAAWTYLRANGTATWGAMEAALRARPYPACPKLRSFWHYEGCRYDKGSFSCAEPDYIDTCFVPVPKLRNGRLNQTAASFYFFVRDIAGRDLVGWIDKQLAQAATSPASGSDGQIEAESLIGPLRSVFGVSDKILTMTLSALLLGASKDRPLWFNAGKSMIAIDTLIHNFLHRTGILASSGASHGYGVGCYAPGGCAAIVRSAASQIDARRFNRQYPTNFPRFVQHAIWRFCAADGINLCNGNRIDDRKPCQLTFCQLSGKCLKIPLKMT